MALRTIVEQGDEVLTKHCRPVEKFDRRLHILLDDMADTLHDAGGVGLAAPQVGVLRRAFIIEVREGELLEFINPEIIFTEGEQEGPEGCLSVPGLYGIVKRPNHVRIKAQNRHGEWFEYEDTELGARALCHENDHLDGHLYTEIATKFLDLDLDDEEDD